jgi:hypothetical protein
MVWLVTTRGTKKKKENKIKPKGKPQLTSKTDTIEWACVRIISKSGF